jgi:hypothetical protein
MESTMNESAADDNQELEDMPDEVRRILAASWGKRRMCLPPSKLAGNWDALLLPYEIEPDDQD